MGMFRIVVVGAAGLSMMASASWGQACTPSQVVKLLPDGGDNQSNFGYATSIAGDVAVVGQWRRDSVEYLDSGKAFVYEFDGANWVLSAELTIAAVENSEHFGTAVATDGTTVVVGAPYRKIDGVSQAGMAFVYRDLGSGWELVASLRAPTVHPGDLFGDSVDVQGNIVVVGAYGDRLDADSEAGAVFVFTDAGSGFQQTAHLQVETASYRAHVGQSVAIDDGVLVAGADDEEGGSGNNGGAAYVWVYDDGWQLIQRLVPHDPQTFKDFGWSVDVRDGTIVVGDPDHSVTGASSGGQAYIYRPDGGGFWTLEAAITPSGVASSDSFAFSVSLADANTLLAGAHNDDDAGSQSGSAFVFRHDGSSWVQTGPFRGSDTVLGDDFGFAVAADGDRAIIGVIGDDDHAPLSGSAYIFDLGCEAVCVPDFTGDSILDFFDVLDFLQAFADMDPSADLAADGVFDFFDVAAFLQAFADGCP